MIEKTPVSGISGNAAADAMRKALDEGLATFRADIEGLKAKVEAHKGADLEPLETELSGLKAKIEALATSAAPVLENHQDQADLVEGFRARLDVIENTLQSPGGAGREVPKTIGEVIFESEGYKAFIADPRNVRKYKHDATEAFKGALSVESILGAAGLRAAPVLGATELGPLDYSARRAGIVMDPLESVDGFIPRIPVVPTPGTELYDYRKETLASQTGFIRTTLAAAIDGDPVPTNACEVADSTHLLVGTYVRFFDDSGNLLGRHAIVTNDLAGNLTFAAGALDFDASIGWNVTSEQWGGTAESDAKPYGFLSAELVQVVLKTIAELIATTRQRLNSAAGLDAWIRRVMPERLRRNLAWHLLYGDATAAGAPQLAGFASETGVQTYLWSSGTVGDNRADALLRAANLVVGRNVTFVMNKRDLLHLRLMKADDGNYLVTPSFGRVSLEMVGGRWVLDGYEIIESDAVVDGDFFAIDFSRASEIADQGTASLEFGLINDQFIRNEITVRYEATLAHAILSTQAYVYGTWDNEPVA